MTGAAPTRVSLYLQTEEGPVRLAEFRLDGGRVTLRSYDDQPTVADEYLADGVPYDAEDREVPPSEPETFMRALLQSPQSSYLQWVDES